MKKEYLYALSSILMWSTFATAAKLLMGEFNNIQVLCISSLIGGIALLIISLFSKNVGQFKNYKLKDCLIMILIGMPGTFLYYAFYYTGAANLLASQAFIINYMWPIMSVVFACIILKERLSVRRVIAIALSFVGVMFVAGQELVRFDIKTAVSMLFCFAAAVCYGLFNALSKKASYDSGFINMLSFFVTFIITTVILALKNDFFTLSFTEFLGFTWNGVFTMAIPNTLWVLALKKGNTAKISNLAYITPFLSMVWTMLFLREPLNVMSVVGLIIMVCGILIQLKDPKNN